MNKKTAGMYYIQKEELKSMIMKDWMCPICKTKGHFAVKNRNTGYCMEKGLWVHID